MGYNDCSSKSIPTIPADDCVSSDLIHAKGSDNGSTRGEPLSKQRSHTSL